MIIINATLKGENTYDITVSETNIYRVSAFSLERAIDLVADYIENHNSKSIYIEHDTLVIMAKCSNYHSTEAFIKSYNLTRCGTNGIYLEITSVKGVHNMSKDEWYEVVAKHITENYNLSAEDIEMATEDIVGRCFCYGVPTLGELPEYITEYMCR